MGILSHWLKGANRGGDASSGSARDRAERLVELAIAAEDDGDLGTAYTRINEAVAADAAYPRAHVNLGNVLRARGDIDNAIAATLTAVHLDPRYAGAHCNLGAMYLEKRDVATAEGYYRAALELQADLVAAQRGLASILAATDRAAEAVDWLRRAVADDPDDVGAALDLARILVKRGERAEAEEYYLRAVALDDECVEACCMLGELYRARQRDDDANQWYAKALSIEDAGADPTERPLLARAAAQVGIALISRSRWEEATAQLRRAIELMPQMPDPYVNLAYLEMRQARPQAAVDLYRRAIALDPSAAVPRSYLLFALNMVDSIDPVALCDEHRAFGEWLADVTPPVIAEYRNSLDPDRPLRVGYVSPDFRDHPVAQFVAPVLDRHDASQCAFFCYSNTRYRDKHTDELQARFGDRWRDLTRLTDDQAADVIRQDSIDILIDLAGHTAESRFGVFARKPAPVQASWLGYLCTTGVRTIDYRIVDANTDPAGLTETHHTERLYRLPGSQWVYAPLVEVPIARPPPTGHAGHVVFGSFNQYPKLNDTCLALWSQVLARLPHARLRVAGIASVDVEEQMLRRLERLAIDPACVEFTKRLPRRQYLAAFNDIDIALDATPYNGATTSLDTLWMGVPVVGLAGSRSISRGTYSLLRTLGKTELIADSPAQYVELNVALAMDAQWRERLHRTLRDDLQRSPLMDVPRFVRNLEAAYRTMWQGWRAGQRA